MNRNLIERAAWTFVEAFLAALLAAPVLDVSLPVVKVAAFAGLAALLSVVKTAAQENLTA